MITLSIGALHLTFFALDLFTLNAACLGQIVWAVSDSLRYTVLVDDTSYAAATVTVVSRLEAQGARIVSLKNYWGKELKNNYQVRVVSKTVGQHLSSNQ